MSPLALISVSDKSNLIPFCKDLVEKFDYKILSSGGTAKHLMEANIPVTKVADFTNSPMLAAALTRVLAFRPWPGCLEYGCLEARSELFFRFELVLARHHVGCDQTLSYFAKC